MQLLLLLLFVFSDELLSRASNRHEYRTPALGMTACASESVRSLENIWKTYGNVVAEPLTSTSPIRRCEHEQALRLRVQGRAGKA